MAFASDSLRGALKTLIIVGHDALPLLGVARWLHHDVVRRVAELTLCLRQITVRRGLEPAIVMVGGSVMVFS